MYPQLSCMALDYLTIPGEFLLDPLTFFLTDIFTATSIVIERLFSTGRLLLSHVRSRLSVQSTCVLLCLNTWSTLGLIKDSDIPMGVLSHFCSLTRTRCMGSGSVLGRVRVQFVTPAGSPVHIPNNHLQVSECRGNMQGGRATRQ